MQLFSPFRRQRAAKLQEARLQPVCNWDAVRHTKPRGGVWTSTYTPNGASESEWVRFCHREHPDWIPAYSYLYTPSPDAQVFTIFSSTDVQALLNRYRRRDGDMIDFEAVSRDFDAVRLADGVLGECIDDPHLYLWDCECTVWFNVNKLRYGGRIRLRR